MVRSLKIIQEEDPRKKEYVLAECSFCHEQLVIPVEEFDNSEEGLHSFKCSVCGHIEKISQDAFKNLKPCDCFGESTTFDLFMLVRYFNGNKATILGFFPSRDEANDAISYYEKNNDNNGTEQYSIQTIILDKNEYLNH